MATKRLRTDKAECPWCQKTNVYKAASVPGTFGLHPDRDPAPLADEIWHCRGCDARFVKTPAS
jgi:ribosomal protein L37AE/L43A